VIRFGLYHLGIV